MVSVIDMANCRPASSVRLAGDAGLFDGAVAASAGCPVGWPAARAATPRARARAIEYLVFMRTSVFVREACASAILGLNSLLPHGRRQPPISPSPVADLAVDVGAPAVRRPCRGDPTRVEAAGHE